MFIRTMNMPNTRLLSAIFLLLCSQLNFAQTGQVLFPGLSGAVLLDSVVAHYKTDTTLSYGMARDTLYAKVLAIDDDTLRCIYSEHALYLDPTQDPTQYVYLSGTANGMNAEHAYPQSKGASVGIARSDMHHLFPTRIAVNETRGSFPFADIPDNQTEKWFFKTTTLTSVPTSQKDRYSEFKTGFFEPREASKGDIARAVFYFYTMYRTQADSMDPVFFQQQRATLCQWHQQDPADEAEVIKTWRIAPYQDNKPNPFVLDCSLVHRCYCPELPTDCLSSSSEISPATRPFQVFPQPFKDQITIRAQLPFFGKLTGTLATVDGKTLRQWESALSDTNVEHHLESLHHLPPGAYSLSLRLSAPGEQTLEQSILLLKMPE